MAPKSNRTRLTRGMQAEEKPLLHCTCVRDPCGSSVYHHRAIGGYSELTDLWFTELQTLIRKDGYIEDAFVWQKAQINRGVAEINRAFYRHSDLQPKEVAP
jgi:hypothetical protein